MSKLRKWMMKEERDTTSSGSGDLSSSAIKLFGKTIGVSASADSASMVSVATKAGSEEVDGASTLLEGENLGSSPGSICSEGGMEGEVENGDGLVPEVLNVAPVVVPLVQPERNPMSPSPQQQQQKQQQQVHQHQPQPQPPTQLENGNPTPQRALTQEEKKEQCLKKPDKLIPCPRCESVDTKFCYYNNYNINQPRHFCKSCQRYWTAGGTLRNVLVGAGRRKNKYGVGSKQDADNPNTHSSGAIVVRMDHHEPAQQPSFAPAVMNAYTLGTVPPMNIPHHGQLGGSDSSTVTTMGLASAFKPLQPEVSSDSVSKLRQRTHPEGTKNADCASSGNDVASSTPTYVLTPRAPPDAQQAVWTKSSGGTPLGFFNGAWPYGYNIGWSGAGAPSLAHSVTMGSGNTPSPVWTGMWAQAAPVGPTFGWNMLQGGWTLPWRPVPAVGVQMQQAQSQGGASTISSTTTTSSPPRKREGATLSEGGERGKIARVGGGEEAAGAVNGSRSHSR